MVKEYEVSDMLLCALEKIDEELSRIQWNINQKTYSSPFDNTANSFECPTFKVEAYSWDDNYDQPYNFKWKDVEISWYKYLGRGTFVNQNMSNDRIAEMLDDCLDALRKYEEEFLEYLESVLKGFNMSAEEADVVIKKYIEPSENQ